MIPIKDISECHIKFWDWGFSLSCFLDILRPLPTTPKFAKGNKRVTITKVYLMQLYIRYNQVGAWHLFIRELVPMRGNLTLNLTLHLKLLGFWWQNKNK